MVFHAQIESDLPPYAGSEIPLEYRQHWVFMELQL